MNGIICWLFSISAILALLPASQRWRNELNKIQEKDVSQQNHDLWWIWPQERLRSCLLQLLQTRGGLRMDIMNLNNLFLTIERGDPLKRQDQTTLRNKVHPGLLKCGKVEIWRARSIRETWAKFLGFTGKSWSSSWRTSSRQDSAFCKERRNYSRKNGETRSEDAQGKANFEKFIVGSDTTEFVNKVKNQVRIRQKRNVWRCRRLYRTFDSLGNVYGYNIECSHIHGKELFHDAECCAEWRKDNTETDVWYHCTNDPQWWRNLLFGQNWVSEEYLDTTVFD